MVSSWISSGDHQHLLMHITHQNPHLTENRNGPHGTYELFVTWNWKFVMKNMLCTKTEGFRKNKNSVLRSRIGLLMVVSKPKVHLNMFGNNLESL